MAARPGLTVAVTGPTGEIGRPLIRALERSRDVGRIVGMARRPFDPAAHGWRKTEYRRGDVLDRTSVEGLVAGADVVVHLAFVIMGGGEDTRRVNLEGTRTVFEVTVAAAVPRLVYASSVAAYGFHRENPVPLTEDVPARGSDAHGYSAQKAASEALLHEVLDGSATEAWVFRPSIVAGPEGLLLISSLPYVQAGAHLPSVARRALGAVPLLRPVLPDPGVPFQLVHHDDVALAMRAGVLGRGEPGAYNLAGPGELRLRDLAEALGWSAVAVPALAVEASAAAVSVLPFLPADLAWVNAFREPVLMDTTKARRLLRWRPRHDARETLAETVAGARAQGLIGPSLP